MADIRYKLSKIIENQTGVKPANSSTIDTMLYSLENDGAIATLTDDDIWGVFYKTNTEKDFWNSYVVFKHDNLVEKFGDGVVHTVVKYVDKKGKEYIFKDFDYSPKFCMGSFIVSYPGSGYEREVSYTDEQNAWASIPEYYIPTDIVHDIKNARKSNSYVFKNFNTILDVITGEPYLMGTPGESIILDKSCAERWPHKGRGVIPSFADASATSIYTVSAIKGTDNGVDLTYYNGSEFVTKSLPYGINLPDYIQPFEPETMSRMSRSVRPSPTAEEIEAFKAHLLEIGVSEEQIARLIVPTEE